MGSEAIIAGEELFPIPLAVMQPGTLAPVNLYIIYQHPAHAILYKRTRAALKEETRVRLLAHGVDRLYVRKKDEHSYYDYVEQNIHAIIRDDLLPVETAAKLVYESSSRVMKQTFEDPRSGRNLKRAHSMVEATVESILKDPETLWHMTGMATHDYYTYTHCVHVCMFLVTAARDLLGISDPQMLKHIGLGGLFHDIGKSQIPEQILNKPGRLTDDEFRTIQEHPALGANLVKRDQKLGRTALQIVRCHHEHFDGGGYPGGLAGEGIGRLSRLAAIVDVYDALTTKRSYGPARDPFHACELMLNQMSAEFDGPLLRAFVKFLGPRVMRLELRSRWDATVVVPAEQPTAASG